MSRRPYLLGLAALVIIAGLAVYVATRTDPSSVGGARTVDSASDLPVLADSVPSLDGGAGWLGSAPLDAAALRGKVVVYDFWTYSCVNCVRTLPHLRALYERYHPLGLEIVGIHSPEFEFEKDHGNVTQAVAQLHVTWPVLLDDDMTVWKHFANQYWPAEYLADQQGRIRSFHAGEGDYSAKEAEIRALLAVPASTPLAEAGAGQAPIPTAQQTPEMHFGTDFGAELYSAQRPYASGAAARTAPADLPRDTFALDGVWSVDTQAATAGDGATLLLRYQGAEVNIVLGLAGNPSGAGTAVPVVVELDGGPVPEGSRPDGMTVDAQGRTVVAVTTHDLYRLVQAGPSDYHTLTLRPIVPGVQAYAFTFGS